MLNLNDLLIKAGVDPKECLVIRYPPERNFLRAFSEIIRTRPDLLDAYQRTQNKTVEGSLSRKKYLVSCYGATAGEAVFLGLFKIDSYFEVNAEEQRKLPERRELVELGAGDESNDRETVLRFNLIPIPAFDIYQIRMILEWPKGERSWVRLAQNNTFNIKAILPMDQIDPPMASWNEVTLNWSALQTLPKTWEARLREWAGIYLIFDKNSQKYYVGSASGEYNLLGRWKDYAISGHGGNKLLRELDPKNFEFSILELTSPNISQEALIKLENSWKLRLHTRLYGLNAN